MAKSVPQSESEKSLFLAVVILTVIAGITAFSAAWICDYVLSAFGNSQAMALIIVDGGKQMKSDDANLEKQLTSATIALQTVRDLGWALAVGCVGIAIAVALRFRKG
jgi:preprotein translocase subunit SecF